MANYQVGQRVKLRSGRIGTIRAILLDSPMPMNARYRVAMEPGAELIGVNGLDVLEALAAGTQLPLNVRNASNSIGAFTRWRAMNAALRDLDEALTLANVKYVLQGSSAALLHGASVSEIPDDLDICVDRLLPAVQALVAPRFSPRPEGSLVVPKFFHQNGTKIDVAMAAEFGVNITRRTAVQGAWILTLVETLTSILIRHEIRRKEIEAFNSLILLKGHLLTVQERALVVQGASNFSEGRITSWDAVLKSARKANLSLKLGV